MVQALTMPIRASDVSGQKNFNAKDVPTDSTIGELVAALVPRMNLGATDAEGRPLSYQALLTREGRHLRSSEIVGETLQPNDRLVLQPELIAG